MPGEDTDLTKALGELGSLLIFLGGITAFLSSVFMLLGISPGLLFPEEVRVNIYTRLIIMLGGIIFGIISMITWRRVIKGDLKSGSLRAVGIGIIMIALTMFLAGTLLTMGGLVSNLSRFAKLRPKGMIEPIKSS